MQASVIWRNYAEGFRAIGAGIEHLAKGLHAIVQLVEYILATPKLRNWLVVTIAAFLINQGWTGTESSASDHSAQSQASTTAPVQGWGSDIALSPTATSSWGSEWSSSPWPDNGWGSSPIVPPTPTTVEGFTFDEN